jgi:hypothetical protein
LGTARLSDGMTDGGLPVPAGWQLVLLLKGGGGEGPAHSAAAATTSGSVEQACRARLAASGVNFTSTDAAGKPNADALARERLYRRMHASLAGGSLNLGEGEGGTHRWPAWQRLHARRDAGAGTPESLPVSARTLPPRLQAPAQRKA